MVSPRSAAYKVGNSLACLDTTMNLMGYAVPPNVPVPRIDATMSFGERAVAFADWCSAYYTHPFYHSGEAKGKRDVSNLMPLPPTPDKRARPSTYEMLSEDEKESCMDVYVRDSEMLYLALSPKLFYDCTLGTFLADHAEDSGTFLPDLRIAFMYCEASIWGAIVGSWDIEADIEKWEKEKRTVRPVTLKSVPGANHFVCPFSSTTHKNRRADDVTVPLG